jgi:hypothetical protein
VRQELATQGTALELGGRWPGPDELAEASERVSGRLRRSHREYSEFTVAEARGCIMVSAGCEDKDSCLSRFSPATTNRHLEVLQSAGIPFDIVS